MSEAVHHPAHYGGGDNPREAIKVIESLGLGWGFALGSAVKYVMRAGRKSESPVEDLNKALWYLRRAVALASAGWDPVSPLDFTVSDRVAPDPDEASRVVLAVGLDGMATLRTGEAALEFLARLELVEAGCPPTWEEGRASGRYWRGELDAIPVHLAFCPFHLPVVLLNAVQAPASQPPQRATCWCCYASPHPKDEPCTPKESPRDLEQRLERVLVRPVKATVHGGIVTLVGATEADRLAAQDIAGPPWAAWSFVAVDPPDPALSRPEQVEAAALPPVASGILDAYVDHRLDEIPAVSWQVATCYPDVEAHELEPDSPVVAVAGYVDSAVGIVRVLGVSLGSQVPASACPAYAVATAGVKYLEPLPQLVVAVASGVLDGEVPAVAVDYSACSG